MTASQDAMEDDRIDGVVSKASEPREAWKLKHAEAELCFSSCSSLYLLAIMIIKRRD